MIGGFFEAAQLMYCFNEPEVTNFQLFNISAQTIFEQAEVEELRNNLSGLLQRKFPRIKDFFAEKNWMHPVSIDRVYCIEKARKMLSFHPHYNISEMLDSLQG